MMDKVSDQYIKAEVCKRDIEERIVAFQKDQRQIEDLQLGNFSSFKSVGGDLERVAKQTDEITRRGAKESYH